MMIPTILLALGALSSVHASQCDPSAGHIASSIPATTSIYYTPSMTSETVQCHGRSYNTIINHRGERVRDCTSILNILNMQGAATVRDARGRYQATYVYQGRNRFAKNSSPNCPMGYGHKKDLCLNPFRTIAAHMASGYKPGDAIYVPKTVGMKYPAYPGQPKSEWATHDGYWVVGDIGGLIKGVGRFDFFTGDMDWRNKDNPMAKLGFGNSKDTVFCRVTESRAEQVRRAIGYPGLTPTVQQALLTNSPAETEPIVLVAQAPAPEAIPPATVLPVTDNAESATTMGTTPALWWDHQDNNDWIEIQSL